MIEKAQRVFYFTKYVKNFVQYQIILYFRNVTEDDRWDTLRSVVTNMRDKDVDPDDLIDDEDLKELKDKYTIQVE